MQLKLIRQTRTDDLAAAQWALIAVVEGTADSTLVRYATPAATEVVGDLLARRARTPTAIPDAGRSCWDNSCPSWSPTCRLSVCLPDGL